jgi:DNA-binding winged helix-turn-helix (wHTH) protein
MKVVPMRYIFGDFTLDMLHYGLHCAGMRVPLGPKIFDLLAYLVRHRQRIVSKQELFQQLWANQFVSDAALARCITAARKAVGDDGDRQQIIQTLYGRGYRFIAAVE